MNAYIVTVKLPRDKTHDPANKKTGACSISPECTDVTGQHHSFITTLEPPVIRQYLTGEGMHLTRIEKVSDETMKLLQKG